MSGVCLGGGRGGEGGEGGGGPDKIICVAQTKGVAELKKEGVREIMIISAVLSGKT